MNPKLFTTHILGLLAATLLVAGCGAKTDPTSDYKDLGATVPAYAGKQDAQGVLAADIFHVDMPGNMNFVEGQEATYPITVSTKLRDISFALTATGLPNGVSLVPIDATHYVVKGTVPVGSSVGLPTGEKIPVTISAVNAKGDQTELHMFSSLLHSWSPTVAVYPTDKMPMVESQKLGLSVNEGETLPISIIVDDVGSHGSQVPKIQPSWGDDVQSGEVSFVSAFPGFRISRTPKALGGGKFEFTGTLDTKKLELPAGKKDVTARLVVNFRSPSNLTSADEIIDVKIVRAAPVAIPAPAVAPVGGETSVAAAPAPAKVAIAKKGAKKAKTAKTAKKSKASAPATSASTDGTTAKSSPDATVKLSAAPSATTPAPAAKTAVAPSTPSAVQTAEAK